jgi:hypothetical protein
MDGAANVTLTARTFRLAEVVFSRARLGECLGVATFGTRLTTPRSTRLRAA